jgi:hypothetical protein
MAEPAQGQGEQELVTLVESDILDVEDPDLHLGPASSTASSDLHARARRCDQVWSCAPVMAFC